MKKQTIGIIGGAVLVIAVIAGLLLWKNNSKDSSKTSTSSSDSSVSSSIVGISDGGRARKCTMSYATAGGNGKGTIYTDGKGQGRMVFTVDTDKGTEGEINQIRKGDTSYTWIQAGGRTVGYKATITSSTTNTVSSTSGPGLNDNFDMKCSSWTVDASQFTVPTDVTFLGTGTLN